ncbi:MAG: RNA-binding protein [Candidatus Cloacimonetes bacterium]|nr:RNA-binding protein [Candidatus Cloacimonadota bacterium]
MRIDQLMNKLCLVKSRSVAKKACDHQLVLINGEPVKASSTVHENDTLQYSIYGYLTVIKIIKIPLGNVSKKNATEYYEVISREKLEVNY